VILTIVIIVFSNFLEHSSESYLRIPHLITQSISIIVEAWYNTLIEMNIQLGSEATERTEKMGQ
jgi:hypothetical protein